MFFELRLVILAIIVVDLIISFFLPHQGNASSFHWIVGDDGSDSDSEGGGSIGGFFD